MIFENNSACLFTQSFKTLLFIYRGDRVVEGKNDSYIFSYTDHNKKDGLQLPPFDKKIKRPTSFDNCMEQVCFLFFNHLYNYFYLTQSQFKDGYKISIIDGLHRCYALLQYLKNKEGNERWQQLLDCNRTVSLKMFVLKKKFRNDMTVPVISHLLNLLKDYSFEIYQQRRATVGHTFFDAIKNTLVGEAKLGHDLVRDAKSDITYLNTNPAVGEKKHFFSRTGKERKAYLLDLFLPRMQKIHKTMCKSDAYLNLLIDKNGQIVKDATSYLETFDKNKKKDKVSIKSVKNCMKYTHILTVLLITSDS